MEERDIESFIKVVKENEILWNMSSPHYKHIRQKKIVWKKIGNEFGVSYEIAKIKWKYLRDTYSRGLKKSVSGLPAEDTDLSWKYSKTMDFLKDQFKPKKTVSNYLPPSPAGPIEGESDKLVSLCKLSNTGQLTTSALKAGSDAGYSLTAGLNSCGIGEAVWGTSIPKQTRTAKCGASTLLRASKRKCPTIEQTLISTMESIQQYLKKPRRETAIPLPSSFAVTPEDELFCRSMLEKLITFPTELRNEAKLEMMRYLCSLQSRLLCSNKEQ